jgi:hypothetical protein
VTLSCSFQFGISFYEVFLLSWCIGVVRSLFLGLACTLFPPIAGFARLALASLINICFLEVSCSILSGANLGGLV